MLEKDSLTNRQVSGPRTDSLGKDGRRAWKLCLVVPGRGRRLWQEWLVSRFGAARSHELPPMSRRRRRCQCGGANVFEKLEMLRQLRQILTDLLGKQRLQKGSVISF